MAIRTDHLADKARLVSPESGPPPFQGTRGRLRVQVEPLACRYNGKVFNDLHAETVSYHIVPHRPYHSYIEADLFRLEADRFGYPVFVCVSGWKNSVDIRPLAAPPNFDLAEVRFLDLRIHCNAPTIQYDPDNALMHIVFKECSDCQRVALEPHAIWSIDTDGTLASLWLVGVVLDPTGKRFLKWRRRAWSRVRKDFRAGRLAESQAPSPISAPEKTQASD